MANIESQKKRNRQNATRAARNRATRSELKTRVKAVGTASGPDGVGEAMWVAQKRLDKAAAKGAIHKNQAARRISRMMKGAATSA